MKKLRLLLLGLLTPLFIGSSFAFDLTSDEITYLNNNALSQGSYINQQNVTLYHNTDSLNIPNICVIFSGFVRNGTYSYNIFPSTNTIWFPESATIHNFATPYFLYCTAFGNFEYLRLTSDGRQSQIFFSTDYYRVLNANKIINGYLGFDVQGLIDDLSRCDTSVQQCLIDKESLSGSLASCNSDKSSLQNYNDALSSQLNECLNNQGTGSIGSGITLVNNSLFWYLDDNLLSLPITNNLFLPLGYQGALDSGNVLYISKLGEEEPTQYYFTEEDKISIIDILSYLFVFILGIGIIFSLIKLFKKIFTH